MFEMGKVINMLPKEVQHNDCSTLRGIKCYICQVCRCHSV